MSCDAGGIGPQLLRRAVAVIKPAPMPAGFHADADLDLLPLQLAVEKQGISL
jgi:hypothetical protein